MKKVVLSVLTIFCAITVFAQSKSAVSNVPNKGASTPKASFNVNDVPGFYDVKSPARSSFKTLALPDTFVTRHGLLTADTNGFIYVNMLYDTVLPEKGLAYTVWFDTLHDSNGSSPTYFPYGVAGDSIVIDTLYAFGSHKKTSSSSVIDSIEFRITDFTGTTLWVDWLTTTTSLFNGNLTGSGAVGQIKIPCGYSIPVNVNGGIGVTVSFRGPVAQDSFSISITYPYKGVCSAGGYSTKPSRFIENTYMFLSNRDTSSTSTPMYADYFASPTALYYNDCNGNNQLDTMPTFYQSDELALAQNASIFLWARRIDRLPTSVASTLTEGSVGVYPNPSTGVFNVALNMTSAVNMNITVSDLQGKVVYSDNVSNSTQMDLSHLNKGVYIFRAATATGSAIQKIVIN